MSWRVPPASPCWEQVDAFLARRGGGLVHQVVELLVRPVTVVPSQRDKKFSMDG